MVEGRQMSPNSEVNPGDSVPIRKVRMSNPLWKRVQHRAVDLNTTASGLIRRYIIRGLAQDDKFAKARRA